MATRNTPVPAELPLSDPKGLPLERRPHGHGQRRPSSQKAMRGIETANPETLYGIFGDAAWSNKDRLLTRCSVI